VDVVLAGFEPFGGESTNPSWEAVKLVEPSGYSLARVELPCTFGGSLAVLEAVLLEHRPSVVICVGQAGGRAEVTPERVAINLNDARIPDNAGNQPVDTPVIPDAPAAYFSTLPVKAAVAAVRSAGIPAALSHSAGTFVCNHVFYGLMHLTATKYPNLRAGFVHVPYSPPQSNTAPTLPLPQTAKALSLITTTTLTTPTDHQTPTGPLH
jgi:pyroglutamyl-peptidase